MVLDTHPASMLMYIIGCLLILASILVSPTELVALGWMIIAGAFVFDIYITFIV